MIWAPYDWHVGDALLQSIGFPVGNKAKAPNGDVVTRPPAAPIGLGVSAET